MKSAGMILAGDVGGTNTRLALFSKEDGLNRVAAVEKFDSQEYKSLGQAVVEMLEMYQVQIEAAVFAVAG